MLTWYCKGFDQLTITELYAILKARQEVFILEQTCLYQDIDSLDAHCLHLFCIEELDPHKAPHQEINIFSYARIIPPNTQYKEASIGRVLTTKNGRQKGLGKRLITKGIEHIINNYPGQPIKISAQYYLIEFYQSFGFKQVSEIYLDDDIQHIDMLLTP